MVSNGTMFLQILALVFTICLYAPLELYLLNRSEFWFKLSMFWWMPLLFSVFVFIVLALIGLLIPCSVRKYYGALVFAGAVCIYIQGNFLNLRIGLLNGGELDWSIYRPAMIRDAVIWAVIILLVMIPAISFKDKFIKTTGYIAFLLIAVQSVSLITLLIPVFTEHDLSAHVENVQTDAHLYEVGSDGNILVFIADMFDDDYFRQIMENDEPVLSDFDGFTYFDNYTGEYSTTADSLDLLLTGRMCYNEKPRDKWREDTWQNRLYLDEVIDDGYEVDFYTPNNESVPDRIKEIADNYEGMDLYITDNGDFFKHLYRLVGCKYLPNAFKPKIWMDGTEFDNLGEYYNYDDSYFRDEFKYNKGLKVAEGKKEFKFIHIMGAHYPYHINDDGSDSPGTTDAYTQAVGTLSEIAMYIDAMKDDGTYGDAAIIVTADHGYYWDGVLSNPVCLIKSPGDHGEIKVDDAPTSQLNLFPTIVRFAGSDNDSDYGTNIFDIAVGDQVDRFFYQYYLLEGDVDGNYRMIEYRIPSESNDVSKWELTDVEYTYHGEKISHSKYCATCINGGEWQNDHEKPRLVHECSPDNPSAGEVKQLENF